MLFSGLAIAQGPDIQYTNKTVVKFPEINPKLGFREVQPGAYVANCFVPCALMQGDSVSYKDVDGLGQGWPAHVVYYPNEERAWLVLDELKPDQATPCETAAATPKKSKKSKKAADAPPSNIDRQKWNGKKFHCKKIKG